MLRTRSALLAAAALTVMLAQTALAADLPQRPVASPLLAPTPVYNWTGIYVGLNGGGGWGRQDPLNLITNRFDGELVDFSGGVFGGTAGAQIQSGHVVMGFEADLDWAGYKGSTTFVPTVAGVPLGGPVSAEKRLTGKQPRGRGSDTHKITGYSMRPEGLRCWAQKPVLRRG